MIGDEWSCWEVQSRTRNDLGEIVEELKSMPQDWVPFDSFNQEIYSGRILQGGGFEIRGWSVRMELLSVQSPPQLNCKSSHPVKPPQVSRQNPSQPAKEDRQRSSNQNGIDCKKGSVSPTQQSFRNPSSQPRDPQPRPHQQRPSQQRPSQPRPPPSPYSSASKKTPGFYEAINRTSKPTVNRENKIVSPAWIPLVQK